MVEKEELREECNITPFLRTLSPGICVVLQYDCQPPAFGTFQGFQHGFVILSDYNGFPGLVRIAACKINAVSPFANCFPGIRESECEFDRFSRCDLFDRFNRFDGFPIRRPFVDFDDVFLRKRFGMF